MPASDEVLVTAERELGVQLPEQYKHRQDRASWSD
ncbi:SMI1/KNR4 family protein [Streptomyces sparsogenes]